MTMLLNPMGRISVSSHLVSLNTTSSQSWKPFPSRLSGLRISWVSSYTSGHPFLLPYIGVFYCSLKWWYTSEFSLRPFLGFDFYIRLCDLIYSHGFNYYLLLTTSKSTFIFLMCSHEIQRHDTWIYCVIFKLLGSWKLNSPHPSSMTGIIHTQFPQHCQFHFLK